MPITEKRDSVGPLPGSFSVQLQDNAPMAVRKDLVEYPLSYVLVTDARVTVGDLSASDFLGVASYAGRIDKMTDDLRVLDGSGLAVLLGDQESKGNVAEGADFTTPAQDFEAHFDAYVAGDGGLTKGDIGTASGTYSYQIATGDTRRDIMRAMCELMPGTNYEWRINPDGSVDADLPATLFTQGNVVLMGDPRGRDGSLVGLASEVAISEIDWTDLSSKTIVDWNDGSSNQTSTNSLTNVVAFDGSAAVYERYMTNRPRRPRPSNRSAVPSWAAAAATEALALAAREAGKYDDARQEIDISVDEYAPMPRFFSVGDTVYVFDPPGLVDLSNEVTYRGETIFPVAVRVMGRTSPIEHGQGVYHYRSDGAGGMEVLDISDHVMWETGRTTIEVGAVKRTLGV